MRWPFNKGKGREPYPLPLFFLHGPRKFSCMLIRTLVEGRPLASGQRPKYGPTKVQSRPSSAIECLLVGFGVLNDCWTRTLGGLIFPHLQVAIFHPCKFPYQSNTRFRALVWGR